MASSSESSLAGASLIPYFKMHALGNSCALLLDPLKEREYTPQFCSKFLDPHFGVGADNLMVVTGFDGGTYSLESFNPDGSAVGLCANGVRCAAWLLASEYVLSTELPRATEQIRFDLDGLKVCASILDFDQKTVEVALGAPRFQPEEIPFLGENSEHSLRVGEREISFSVVNLGNPHAVVFLDAPADQELVNEVGSILETHPLFPERTNVEFVSSTGRHSMTAQIWERGVGTTLSSGSGASASAVCSIRRGIVENPVEVTMPGGVLKVFWEQSGGTLRVQSNCSLVSTGDYLD